MTQTGEVLQHLKDFGSITSWEAITEYGATRLSSIIHNLRGKGYHIESEMLKTTNRYGRQVSFAKYILVEENND